jgi:BON domain
VKNGNITLIGTVSYDTERTAAEQAVAGRLPQRPEWMRKMGKISDAVVDDLTFNPDVDASDITVKDRDGEVVLAGSVRSYRQDAGTWRLGPCGSRGLREAAAPCSLPVAWASDPAAGARAHASGAARAVWVSDGDPDDPG